MSESFSDKPEADLDRLIDAFTQRLIDESVIEFDGAGLIEIDSKALVPVNYRAILEGFGFSPGFQPRCSNTL